MLFIPDDLATGPRVVEAVLHMDYLPPRSGKDVTPFPGAWRYELAKAAVVGPRRGRLGAMPAAPR